MVSILDGDGGGGGLGEVERYECVVSSDFSSLSSDEDCSRIFHRNIRSFN